MGPTSLTRPPLATSSPTSSPATVVEVPLNAEVYYCIEKVIINLFKLARFANVIDEAFPDASPDLAVSVYYGFCTDADYINSADEPAICSHLEAMEFMQHLYS